MTYTHLGQVHVYECVALTQLGPSLAGLCWDARVLGFLQRVRGFLLHQLRFAQRCHSFVWFATYEVFQPHVLHLLQDRGNSNGCR